MEAIRCLTLGKMIICRADWPDSSYNFRGSRRSAAGCEMLRNLVVQCSLGCYGLVGLLGVMWFVVGCYIWACRAVVATAGGPFCVVVSLKICFVKVQGCQLFLSTRCIISAYLTFCLFW